MQRSDGYLGRNNFRRLECWRSCQDLQCIPENYIFAIESVDNDTQITPTESVANVNIQSDGLFIDKLETLQ